MTQMQDTWVKALTTGGNIKAVAIYCTQLCREICQRHQLKGEYARALSEALVGGLTLAANSKKDQVLNLNIKSNTGPIKQVFVDVNWLGEVRGYLVAADESLGIDSEQGPWGAGMIQVLRATKGSMEIPFKSTVPMVTGHLAKDLTYYWVQSEQIPSAVGLQVFLDEDGDSILGAGGFLVQAMPGATDEELELVEQAIQKLPDYPDGFDGKYEDPKLLLANIFSDQAISIIDEHSLKFKCSCSEDRVAQTLMVLTLEDLSGLEKQPEVSIRCDFCGTEYQVTPERIRKIREQKAQQEA